MGASLEIIKPLREHKFDLEYGSYLRQEQVEAEAPITNKEWDEWLESQNDPGNYDAYKVVRDGKIEWVCDVFMPAKLISKLIEELKV